VRNGTLRNRATVADDDDSDLDRGSALSLLTGMVMRNPRDSLVAMVAAAAVAAIFINGLFLQPGPHPAPIFPLRPQPVASGDATGGIIPTLPRPRPAEAENATVPSRPRADNARGPAQKGDAIATLLVSPRQLMAIQRALSEYGYGPVKATGVYDAETRATIERFERDRKLPITGQASDRLIRELSTLTGRPLD
jgi:hypothetical protein